MDIQHKRLFAYKYYGSKYKYKNDFGTYSGVVGDFHTNEKINNESFCLLLKSIDKITDEDAIELYSIKYPDDECLDSHKIGNVKQSVSNIIENDFPIRNSLVAIDFLRAKGYALPYMKYSVSDLIKAGVIKIVN